MPLSSRFQQILDQRMIKELTIQGNKIVEKARNNASWSKSIPNAIKLGEAKKTGNGYEIEITIDSRRDGPAPHAAAFEYGSGERGPTGEPYLIEPRDAGGRLVIPRKRWPKYVEDEEDVMGGIYRDPIILRSVLHPGVKAKPYLHPAIKETRAGFVTSLAKLIKLAYLDSTVRVEVIRAEK